MLGLYAAPYSFAHRHAALPHASADAAPFCTPAEGMARSAEEIHRTLSLLQMPDDGRAQRGSTGYLSDLSKPLRSDAADHLIATARATPEGDTLYVVALGCVTNIASALLLAPDIAQRIVVVWTSGYPSHAPQVNHSFNLEQDMLASRWLLDSGVPHVYLPGFHVGRNCACRWPRWSVMYGPAARSARACTSCSPTTRCGRCWALSTCRTDARRTAG